MNGVNLPVVYNNFLNDKEIPQIGLTCPTWEHGRTNEPSDLRIVKTHDITHKLEWLDFKVLAFVKKINKDYGYDISSWNAINETKLLKYDVGGKYDWHQDVLWSPKEHRKFTYIIQLTNKEEYEGGDFEFRDAKVDLANAGDRGTIIVFPSLLYHRITPLTKGSRQSIVGWVVGPRWK